VEDEENERNNIRLVCIHTMFHSIRLEGGDLRDSYAYEMHCPALERSCL
jgi:hypothetical protein